MATFVIGASVVSADTVASGECGAQGDNLTWTLDDQGTLTISGYGEMENYDTRYIESDGYITSAPWGDYYSELEELDIGRNVTTIGDNAFIYCKLV